MLDQIVQYSCRLYKESGTVQQMNHPILAKFIWYLCIKSLKYLRSITLGCKDIGNRNSEFVSKLNFLFLNIKVCLQVASFNFYKLVWLENITHILDPGSHILDPGSHILDPGSHILDPGSLSNINKTIFN